MKCEQVRELIPDWLGDETEAFQAEAIKKHIDKCPLCRDEVSFWQEIGTTLRDEGNDVKAPPGFAAGVVAQLPERRDNLAGRLVARWKRSVAAAAAFLLVAAGSAGVYLQWGGNPVTHVVQENPPAITIENPGTDDPGVSPAPDPEESGSEDPGTENGENRENGETSVKDNTPEQPGTGEEEPGTQTQVEEDPGASGSSTGDNVETPGNTAEGVWLNSDKSRVIERTFLKVSVNDFDATREQVIQQLNNTGAQYEVLGSENSATGSQEQIKIVVDNSQTEGLLKNLKSLGQVISDDRQQNDITGKYNEKLEQYRSLEAQLAGIEDGTEKEQMQVQMASIQNQLKNWDKEADTDTIILWLEN